MKMSAMALAVAGAALWGGGLFAVGLANLAFPSYGADFLRMVSSIYPGYDGAPHVGSLLIGTVWGLADGWVGGYLLAWLYNQVQERLSQPKDRPA
jgi:hypothetical protein